MNLGPVLLVVDDSEDDLFAFRRVLMALRSDAIMLESCSATDASLILKKEGRYSESPSPQVIVADWDMNGETALDLLRWVRVHPNWRRVPYVVLTGDQNPKIVAESLEHGATAVLHKPVSPVELTVIVTKILSLVERGGGMA